MAFVWFGQMRLLEMLIGISYYFGADSQTFKHMVNKCPLQSFHQGIAALHSETKAELK